MDYSELDLTCLFCFGKYCYWFFYYFDCIGGRHFLMVSKRFSFHLSHFWPFNLYCCDLWLVISVGDVTIYRQFHMVHLINLYCTVFNFTLQPIKRVHSFLSLNWKRFSHNTFFLNTYYCEPYFSFTSLFYNWIFKMLAKNKSKIMNKKKLNKRSAIKDAQYVHRMAFNRFWTLFCTQSPTTQREERRIEVLTEISYNRKYILIWVNSLTIIIQKKIYSNENIHYVALWLSYQLKFSTLWEVRIFSICNLFVVFFHSILCSIG